MEKYGYIYKITHKPTGFYYIGKRVGFGDYDTYYGSGTAWEKEILNKHPLKEFKKELLKVCSTKEELLEEEKRAVGDLWFTDSKDAGGKCYNRTSGGHSSWDAFWLNATDEERQAFAEKAVKNAKKTRNHLGHKHSKEARLKMSEKAKLRKASPETREKMRKSMLGKNKRKHSTEQNQYQAKVMKSLWSDPEFRAKRSLQMKQGWAKRKEMA